jgi:hypothetical protein
VHHTERGERVHDRGFFWGVTADPGLRQDADGRYLRLGVRHRLKRTADLDGEVDAEPGLKIRALSIIAPAELVERGCIEVIVTTFSPRRCDRIARAGIERRSRAVAWPCSQAPTESRGLCP